MRTITLALVSLCAVAAFGADTTQVAAARNFRFHGMAIGMTPVQLRKAIPQARRDTADVVGITGSIDSQRGQQKWSVRNLAGGANASFEFRDSACYAISWNRPCEKAAFVKALDSLETAIGRHHSQEGNTYGWLFDGMGRKFTLSFEPMVGMCGQVTDVKTVERLVAKRAEGP